MQGLFTEEVQRQLQELIESMRGVRVDFISVLFTSIDYIARSAVLTISLHERTNRAKVRNLRHECLVLCSRGAISGRKLDLRHHRRLHR